MTLEVIKCPCEWEAQGPTSLPVPVMKEGPLSLHPSTQASKSHPLATPAPQKATTSANGVAGGTTPPRFVLKAP